MSIVKYWAAMQLDTWNHLSRTNLFKGKIVHISFFGNCVLNSNQQNGQVHFVYPCVCASASSGVRPLLAVSSQLSLFWGVSGGAGQGCNYVSDSSLVLVQ